MLLLQETMAESCGREILQKGLGFDVDFRVNQEIISSKTDISKVRKNRMRMTAVAKETGAAALAGTVPVRRASAAAATQDEREGQQQHPYLGTQPSLCTQPEEQARPRTVAGRPQDESLQDFFERVFWSSIGTRLTINKVLLTWWLFTLAWYLVGRQAAQSRQIVRQKRKTYPIG